MGLIKKYGHYYADYIIKLPNGKILRKRPSLETADKSVAQIAYAKLLEARYKKPDGIPTYTEFKARYLDQRQHETAQRTYGHDLFAFKSFDEFLEAKEISIDKITDITFKILDDYKLYCHEMKRQPSAINRSVRSLKQAMRQAEMWYELPEKKWEKIKKLKEKRNKVRFFTIAEQQALLKLCKGAYRTIALLGLRMGLRRGEIVSLTWDKVDFTHWVVKIYNKNGEFDPKSDNGSRAIPIRGKMRTYLKQLHAKSKSNLVLGETYSLGGVTTYMERLITKAGLDGSLHTTRHSFGALLAQQGKSLYQIGKLMGHSSEKVTELYGHLQASTFEDLIDSLPDLPFE